MSVNTTRPQTVEPSVLCQSQVVIVEPKVLIAQQSTQRVRVQHFVHKATTPAPFQVGHQGSGERDTAPASFKSVIRVRRKGVKANQIKGNQTWGEKSPRSKRDLCFSLGDTRIILREIFACLRGFTLLVTPAKYCNTVSQTSWNSGTSPHHSNSAGLAIQSFY